MLRKRTWEEVEEIVNSLGYELVDDYYKGYERRVVINDEYGYKYDVVLNSLTHGYKPQFVSISNPYSLENISLWLIHNSKSFYLVENDGYCGWSEKLNFHCTVCNEDFNMSWNQLSQNQGCSICSGKQVGERTSLFYLRPDLMDEWNFEKNEISPTNVTEHSHEYAWWICKRCGYDDWFTSINTRTSLKTGCPACSGRVVTDNNRLSTLYPEISAQWHPDKNNPLAADDVSYASNMDVWWKCPTCGREWKALICSRTRYDLGCGKCNSSLGERRIIDFLEQNDIEYIHQYKFNNCRNQRVLPFDFYLPDYNLLIEYDGILHFKDKFNNEKEFQRTLENDKIKNDYCKRNQIPLLRIPYLEFDNIEQILTETLL
jgi:very-short-patch-repair endonuclease